MDFDLLNIFILSMTNGYYYGVHFDDYSKFNLLSLDIHMYLQYLSPNFLRFCEFYQEGNCPTDLLIDFDILNHFDILILNHDLYIKTAWTPPHLFLIYVNSKEIWIETVKVRNISRLVRKMKTKNPRRTCVEFQIQPGTRVVYFLVECWILIMNS